MSEDAGKEEQLDLACALEALGEFGQVDELRAKEQIVHGVEIFELRVHAPAFDDLLCGLALLLAGDESCARKQRDLAAHDRGRDARARRHHARREHGLRVEQEEAHDLHARRRVEYRTESIYGHAGSI